MLSLPEPHVLVDRGLRALAAGAVAPERRGPGVADGRVLSPVGHGSGGPAGLSLGMALAAHGRVVTRKALLVLAA